jgi:uncharacterized repeat protein (TIGR03943 family)
VRPTTQGLVLVFLGVVLVRLAVGGEYLSFVTPWMRWPIIASGALLILIAARPALGLGETRGTERDDDHDDEQHDRQHGEQHAEHGVPLVTWLLLLPGLVVFTVSPPALGAYLAERRADEVPSASPTSTFSPLPAGDDVPVELEEFAWRAQIDDGLTLQGRSVTLTGFVTRDDDGWYVTRLSLNCCAADATVVRIGVDGTGDAPARNSWVEVAGTWVDGSGTDRREVPRIAATAVTPVDEPRQTYQ